MSAEYSHSLMNHHHEEHHQRYSERGLEESIVIDEENQPHKFVLINGLEIAAEIKEEIKRDIERIVEKQKGGQVRRPGLAVVMVGSRKDSLTYVQRKQEACAELGIESFKTHFEDDQSVTDEDVIKTIQQYNADDRVHGILVQLPLPSHLNEEKILESISPAKDVDGLTQFSFGLISMKGRKLVDGINFVPCTPLGIMEMIRRTAQKLNMNLEGLDSVVVGASNIVGIPTALVLLNQLQTSVQLLHIKSQNIPEKISKADILVVCCGCAEIIKPEWIKKGAIVIDVGLTPVEDKTQERGFRLVGDVLFDDNLKKRASAATPGKFYLRIC